MKKFLLLSLVLTACCFTQITPKLAEPTIIKENPATTQKEQEELAWKYVEDEELVSILEKSDFTKWSVVKNFVLSDFNELNIWLKKNSHIYLRVSIYKNGTILLDGEKRDMTKEHQERLEDVFNAIIIVKNENGLSYKSGQDILESLNRCRAHGISAKDCLWEK